MAGKVRCQKCGAGFMTKDLSGNPRTECPVCRAPFTAAPEPAPVPETTRSSSSTQPAASRTPGAVTSPPTTHTKAASHARTAGGKWMPPAGSCNHAGYRLDASKFFPWGPPAAIGEVLFAESNVPQSGPPSLMTPILIAIGILAAVYVAFGEGLPLLFPTKADPNVLRAMAGGLGLVAGGLTLAWMWPAPLHCTYVGKEGAAYFIGRWGHAAPSESQVILFREIAALFSSTTHFYKNFIYERTMFCVDLHKDVNGSPALRVADEHTYQNNLPPPDHLYHFALRVEDVWTKELIARLDSELSAGRTLSFPCRKSTFTEMMAGMARPNNMREIRLSRGQLQFVYDDRTEIMALSDLGSFQAQRGVLKFDQHDASWFSRQGKFRIDYQHLGNAQAFLHYLSIAVVGQ